MKHNSFSQKAYDYIYVKACSLRKVILILLMLLSYDLTVNAQNISDRIVFEKRQLSTSFHAEGVGIGDIDHDGNLDIISGPYWYKGPQFQTKKPYYQPRSYDRTKEYANNFIVGIDDVNHDSWNDILIVGFPGDTAFWFENPKDSNQNFWKRHIIYPNVDNESPTFFDINNDGSLELVFHTHGQLGYASPSNDSPTNQWTFHAVSDTFEWGKFTHGLGVGDINDDGYQDLIKNDGWWLNPGDESNSTRWKYHPVDFGPGGAQMYAYDVNQDGFKDVITSLDAHGYGLAWFQQEGEGEDISFKRHMIMGKELEDNPFGVRFSQLHALSLVDVNKDGLNDLITGKRVWTRGPQDGWEPDEPAVLYYFELRVDKESAQATYLPFIIDSSSGVGVQIATADLNNDNKVDIVTVNKNGTFIFYHTGAQ